MHGWLPLPGQRDRQGIVRMIRLQPRPPPGRQIEQFRAMLRTGLAATLLPNIALTQKMAQAGVDQPSLVAHARVAPRRLHRLINQREFTVRRQLAPQWILRRIAGKRHCRMIGTTGRLFPGERQRAAQQGLYVRPRRPRRQLRKQPARHAQPA